MTFLTIKRFKIKSSLSNLTLHIFYYNIIIEYKKSNKSYLILITINFLKNIDKFV